MCCSRFLSTANLTQALAVSSFESRSCLANTPLVIWEKKEINEICKINGISVIIQEKFFDVFFLPLLPQSSCNSLGIHYGTTSSLEAGEFFKSSCFFGTKIWTQVCPQLLIVMLQKTHKFLRWRSFEKQNNPKGLFSVGRWRHFLNSTIYSAAFHRTIPTSFCSLHKVEKDCKWHKLFWTQRAFLNTSRDQHKTCKICL